MTVNKPRRLQSGGRIGVIAPAGCVDADALERGLEAIRAEGFEIELGANIFARKGYLAGEAEKRAQDLLGFFQRGDIDAIFCVRGGFGSIQLLPYLSTDLSNYPKIFVGYSDITVLLTWLRQAYGIVTFHAPMVAEDIARGLSAQGKLHLWPVLRGEQNGWSVCLDRSVRPGITEAEMIGGCLSILVTTLGTPYEIDTRDKLLFIEDIGERPYRVERMLTHLKFASKLDEVAGVIFGDFINCEDAGSRGVGEVIDEMFRDAPYPVAMGIRAGHGPENFALPFGAQIRLNGTESTLTLLESPVS